jgi:hypothetical protein
MVMFLRNRLSAFSYQLSAVSFQPEILVLCVLWLTAES